MLARVKQHLEEFKKAMLRNASDSWHRDAVGGLWDQIGSLQFEFVVSQGLKPWHNFLDVGCGSLRGGTRFIKYLEEKRYFGVDKDASLLRAGREFELSEVLREKKPTLIQLTNFEFSCFKVRFNFALAQSVFTHLPMGDIAICLRNIREVLCDDGRFFATFFEVPPGKCDRNPLVHHPGDVTTFCDRDPYHYTFQSIEEMARSNGLAVAYLGNWNHPRGQKMLVFSCSAGPRSCVSRV